MAIQTAYHDDARSKLSPEFDWCPAYCRKSDAPNKDFCADCKAGKVWEKFEAEARIDLKRFYADARADALWSFESLLRDVRRLQRMGESEEKGERSELTETNARARQIVKQATREPARVEDYNRMLEMKK